MRDLTQVAIIGAGPAGLSAALEIAKRGGQVTVFDENARPGGQLFKQIHKFFGSEYHGAGIRGVNLGEQLLQSCIENKVNIMLDSAVFGIFPNKEVGVASNGRCSSFRAEKILIATGATERPINFPGWTLPGVMGAGAAQTMMNIHRVLPGKKVLMIGSGNVGLVVSYQILQAGGEVVAIVEALPKVNGYMVHANKVMRNGVPIYTSHTIKEAFGDGRVEKAVIVEVDSGFSPVPGSEKTFEADTVCLAVGLNPSVELARLAGCRLVHIPRMGGFVPSHNEEMMTSVPGVYVAGDIAGIEEASTAMEEGRLAGISIAYSLDLMSEAEYAESKRVINERIEELRSGPHGKVRREGKQSILRGYQQ